MSKKIVFYNNDITDIRYSGYTITKVYSCGGQLVYEANPGLPVVTYDYVEKERQNQDVDYIDLVSGITSLSNAKIEIKAMFTYNSLWSSPNNRHRLFGWKNADGYAQNMEQNCTSYYLENIYTVSSGGSVGSISSDMLDKKTTDWFLFTFNIITPSSSYNLLDVYNITDEEYTVQNKTIMTSDVFRIFNIEGSGKISYVKVYDNNVLIHHFVPGKTKSENKPVMYDLVTGNSVSLPDSITCGNL